MSAPEPMPTVRRRPIPGMTGQPATAARSLPPDPEPTVTPETTTSSRQTAKREGTHEPSGSDARSGDARGKRPVSPPATPGAASPRRPAADYAATRLANFRIPVDLHDRYRDLVRDAERIHPRLRRASLTEVIIGLLEEGPGTADEVAELIWRKRAAEHGGEL
jgi:hypothetical protein